MGALRGDVHYKLMPGTCVSVLCVVGGAYNAAPYMHQIINLQDFFASTKITWDKKKDIFKDRLQYKLGCT